MRSASMTSEVSSTLRVVWVTKQRSSGFFTLSLATSSGVSTRYMPPSGFSYCPMVPITSG
ncbi:hypothetical protein D3C72_2558570 [compost metagenome]